MARRDRRSLSGSDVGSGPAPVLVDAVPVHRRSRGLIIGLVVAGIVVAVPVLAWSLRGSNGGPVVRSDAQRVVVAALGTTAASGRYEMTTTLHIDPPHSGGVCAGTVPNGGSSSSATCVPSGLRAGVDITSHATVNLNPYALASTSFQTGLGEITTYFNGTTVWEIGGGNYGATTGSPLSGFAQLVVGTLGPGPGATAMIGIASHGGCLNLEQAAVEDASPGGTGTLDGTTLTYYDITIDIAKVAEASDLTNEERATVQEALPLLKSAGYTGTTEHIGIDDSGLIREITGTERFSDGSAEVSHTILSNFGCAPTVYLPNETPPPVTATTPCQPAGTTTTPSPATSPPASSTAPSTPATPTSTLAPSTTVLSPSTTATPTTILLPSTSASP